jgi:hypothetical protein
MTYREQVEMSHALLLASLKQLLADVLYGGARSMRDDVWDLADERFCEFKAACARHETAQRVARAEHVREPEWRSSTRIALRGALSAMCEPDGAMTLLDMPKLVARIESLLAEDHGA